MSESKTEVREKKCKCLTISKGAVYNVSHPLRYYEFTQEELKALEQCEKESFYLRCLPMSTGFAALTYAAIRGGKLRSNPHFGPFPKLGLAAAIGYFTGLFASKPLCDKRFRKLPDGSHLGNTMRQYYDKKVNERQAAAEAKAKKAAEDEALWTQQMAQKRVMREEAEKKRLAELAEAEKKAKAAKK